MHKWLGNGAGDELVECDEAGIKQDYLPTIKKLLETENLREFNEDAISGLATELRETIMDVRKTPAAVLSAYNPSRDAILKNLRSASIQLNLAWDQLETKGKSSRFYQCLLACKEYLEKAVEQNVEGMNTRKKNNERLFPTTFGSAYAESLSPGTFLTQLQTFLSELDEAQLKLQDIYKLFEVEDELWVAQCNDTISTLRAMSEYLQNFCELLDGAVQLPTGISPSSYELIVKLCHVDKQARTLASLITSFRSVCQTKSRQVAKLKEEIQSKLELLIQSNLAMQQMITLLKRQLHLYKGGTTRHLRLVHLEK